MHRLIKYNSLGFLLINYRIFFPLFEIKLDRRAARARGRTEGQARFIAHDEVLYNKIITDKTEMLHLWLRARCPGRRRSGTAPACAPPAATRYGTHPGRHKIYIHTILIL